jgi:hypothetical protein
MFTLRVGDAGKTVAARQTFWVADLPAADYDLILRMPFLTAHNPVPDYRERELTFPDGAIAMALVDQPHQAPVHAATQQRNGSRSEPYPTLRRRLLAVLCLQQGVRVGEDIQAAILGQVEQTADGGQV